MLNITRILISLSIVEMYAVSADARPIGNSVALVSRYLTKFGYIDPIDTISRRSLNSQASQISTGVKKFQSFMGLNETGDIDESTWYTMTLKRCGNKDIQYSSRRYLLLNETHWPFSNITYSIEHHPTTVNREKTAHTIRKAFNIWSQVVPLKFKQTNLEKSNIKIDFLVGEHGDGNPFAKEGEFEYTLAHSTSYPNSFIHFSNVLHWKVGHGKGDEDLLQVATHEIGHVLGLAHSPNKKSIMYTSCDVYMKKVKLHEDDIEGVQAIYGKKEKVRHKNRKPKLGKGHIKNVKKNLKKKTF